MFIMDINDNFPMTSSIQLMTMTDDKPESKSLSCEMSMSENVTAEGGKVNNFSEEQRN